MAEPVEPSESEVVASSNDAHTERSLKWPVIGIGLVVVTLWAGTGWFLHDLPPAERGAYGDMFGAINALFSGMAFLGVIFAILLQRQELKLQREELALTRNELSGSREAQELLAKHQHRAAMFSALATQIDVLVRLEGHAKAIVDGPLYGDPGPARERYRSLTRQREQADQRLFDLLEDLEGEFPSAEKHGVDNA